MARYHRVNIDGKSVTETRITAAALKPGTFAAIQSGEFAQSAVAAGRMYVIHPANHEGGTIVDEIAQGQSAVGEYVEEGRELVVLCAAGTYTKDTPIGLGASGQGTFDVDETDTILGYSQDAVTLSAAGFIRVRMRAQPGLPAVTGVTIDQGSTETITVLGGTLQLTASVAPAGANPAVTWASGTIANMTVDASTGLVTAIKNGASVITATTVSGSETDTITVTASNQAS